VGFACAEQQRYFDFTTLGSDCETCAQDHHGPIGQEDVLKAESPKAKTEAHSPHTKPGISLAQMIAMRGNFDRLTQQLENMRDTLEL